MQKLHMNLGIHSYDIIIERGGLKKLHQYTNLKRKVLIISDTGVPKEYMNLIKKQCHDVYTYVFPQGEDTKCLASLEQACTYMMEHHFSRNDLILALGGGVVGDLAGFVAASYMRGIDFIQIPTTTLSQIDSSIGGKVAVNLGETKNIIGAFYQPKLVLIDSDTLQTLPRRHYMNGLVEALKAGLIYDKQLFELFLHGDLDLDLDTIIYHALCVKKAVVEQDEKEMGLRKILNFGHTIGHAIESYYHLDTYYHGECVAAGMLFFIEDTELKKQLLSIYKKMDLPFIQGYNTDEIIEILKKDKKAQHDYVSVIKVKEAGKSYIENMNFEQIKKIMDGEL